MAFIVLTVTVMAGPSPTHVVVGNLRPSSTVRDVWRCLRQAADGLEGTLARRSAGDPSHWEWLADLEATLARAGVNDGAQLALLPTPRRTVLSPKVQRESPLMKLYLAVDGSVLMTQTPEERRLALEIERLRGV